MCTFLRNLLSRCLNWCCCCSNRRDNENGDNQGPTGGEFEMGPIITRNNLIEGVGGTGTGPSSSNFRSQSTGETSGIQIEDRMMIQDHRNERGGLQRASKTIYRRPAGNEKLSPPSRPWYDTNV